MRKSKLYSKKQRNNSRQTRGMCLFGKCSNYRLRHRCFIEPISQRSHLKFYLLKREIKLNLRTHSDTKRVFSLLEEDTNSIIGKNLHMIMKLCGKSNLRNTTNRDLQYSNEREEMNARFRKGANKYKKQNSLSS